MRLLRSLSLAIALLAPAVASAEEAPPPVRIQGGFFSGFMYMDMYEQEKLAYVAGILDGMVLAPHFGANPARMDWLSLCMRETDAAAMRDGVTAYLRAHTDQWESRNPAKMFRGVSETCRQQLATLPPPPPGAEPPPPQRAMDGNAFMALYGTEKRAYVAGLLEGMLLAPAFGGIEARMEWLLTCIDGLGLTKLRDEVTTYVRLHPERWEGRDPALMFDAVSDACRRHLGQPQQGG